MRSHSIRNVLRGLIAAGLLAIGADSYGHSAVRHYTLSHACFLNDFDSDSHIGAQRNLSHDAFLAAFEPNAMDSIVEIHECERMAAMHDARSHVNAFLSHRVPRISNELLLGFRTGFSWIGLLTRTQNAFVDQSNGTLLKLAETVGRSQPIEMESSVTAFQRCNIFVYTFEDESRSGENIVEKNEPTELTNEIALAELNSDNRAAYNPLQTGMDPICTDWQSNESIHAKYFSIANACTIVEDNMYLEEITASTSPTIEAANESVEDNLVSRDYRNVVSPVRPPVLEGDSTPTVASQSNSDFGHCGLGHCEAGFSGKELDLLADVPNYLANVERLRIDDPDWPIGSESFVHDRNVIDSWTATDWNVKHWYWKSQSQPTQGMFLSSPNKRVYPDLALLTDRSISNRFGEIPLDPALYPSIASDNFASSEIVELPSSTTLYTPGPWFTDLVGATQSFAKSQWQLWIPTIDRSRKQTNRITASQLRNIGLFFLKSASLIEATGFEAEVAGRDQTQR
jgi:hypothetical protein